MKNATIRTLLVAIFLGTLKGVSKTQEWGSTGKNKDKGMWGVIESDVIKIQISELQPITKIV